MLKPKMQPFRDGVCNVYFVEDGSNVGDIPTEALKHKLTLRFDNRTVGMKRFYEAAMADIKIDLVIRIPRQVFITTQDIVMIGNDKYRIKQIQQPDRAIPLSTDLSLERIAKE